jgi:hypothetical protein
MSTRVFSSSVVFVSALCISAPATPAAFAAADVGIPSTGAVILMQSTPTQASLGNSIRKGTDFTGLAKKAPRRRVAR